MINNKLSGIFLLAFGALLISGCSKESGNQTESVKVSCDAPALHDEMAKILSTSIYKPEFLMKDAKSIIKIDITGAKQTQKSSTKLANGKSIDKVTCLADISISLVDPKYFENAKILEQNIDVLVQEGGFRKSGYAFVAPTNRSDAPNTLAPVPTASKGTITYEATEEMDAKRFYEEGWKYAVAMQYTVKGLAEFVNGLKEADRIYSMPPAGFKPRINQSVEWSAPTKDQFDQMCRGFGNQLSQCDCAYKEMKNGLTENDYLKISIASVQIEEFTANPEAFPFLNIKKTSTGELSHQREGKKSIFSQAYPDLIEFQQVITNKCFN